MFSELIESQLSRSTVSLDSLHYRTTSTQEKPSNKDYDSKEHQKESPQEACSLVQSTSTDEVNRGYGGGGGGEGGGDGGIVL